MVAPTGARRAKADHPALPVTPAEVAATARACRDAGATAIHLHARDDAGAHTLEPAIYDRFIGAVRDAVGADLFLQVTTEAVGRYGPAEQIAAIRGLGLRPDGVSLALRELLAEGADHTAAQAFFGWLLEADITPQVILYAPAELARFQALRRQGTIPAAVDDVLFVLGRYLGPGEAIEPRTLLDFLALGEPALRWMVCAFGREETACLATAAALGGDLRVGFENALQHGDGSRATDNAERVAAIVGIVERIGRRRERSGAG